MTGIKEFFAKDATTVRDDVLRTVKAGLQNRGIADPDVGPGSEEWVWGTALGRELEVAGANTIVKGDELMPDTATGPGLVRWLRFVGLSMRSASVGTGAVVLSCSVTTFVPTGAQLIDSTGQRYQVSVGGTYSNGALIPVVSLDTGKTVNHLAGDTLKWVATPAYSDSKALVANGGITGAADAEDEETARARLLARLQNPPASGNWAHMCALGEASNPIVQKAFCYPAVGGPATAHLAVVGYASSVSKNRDVDSTILSSIIAPYVLGQLPEYAEFVITTVANVSTDVSIGLSLPAAPSASPAGPGGGWLDGTPWPAISGTGSTYANVTAVTSGTVFTMNAPSSPTVNVSRIAFLDPTTWTLYRAKVIGVTGTGPWTITIDQPFPTIAAALALGGTGPLIFPDSTNAQLYIAAFLNAMAAMGPGEKTANASVLTRGYRHPIPSLAWPYSLGAPQLKTVSNVGSEVLDTNYYFRSTTTPAVPGAISSPPNQLVPRHLGLYPI